MANAGSAPYPVRFGIEDLEQQSRWKAALRLPLALPTLLFAVLLLGGFTHSRERQIRFRAELIVA